MTKLIRWYLDIPILHKMLGAFVLGTLIGILVWGTQGTPVPGTTSTLEAVLSPFGMVLVKMLKIIVIPLIFFSLFQGASSLPLKKSGRIGLQVIGLYLLTSLVAAILGTVFALILDPDRTGLDLQQVTTTAAGAGAPAPKAGAGALAEIFLGLFENPFGALAAGNFLPIIVFAILAANLFGLPLSLPALFTLVITTVLAAIGAGGIPGGSLMLLFLILQTMGLQEQQISLIVAFALGINPILDMFETMNNVAGDLACTYVVAHREGMIGKASAAGQPEQDQPAPA